MFVSTHQQRAKRRVLAISLGLLVTTGVSAQIPDQFTNLQVLPQEIGKRELLDVMKSFTSALSVRCQHCHIGEEGKPLTTFDFVSDAKTTKQTARVMLQMVQAINNEHLAKVANQSMPVSCNTCHHGENRPPRPLEEILFELTTTEGTPAAIKKYHDLREKYFGGAVYDFREGTLNRLASRLSTAKKNDDALAVLKLNAEVNPKTAMTYFFMAEIYLERGEKAAAIEHYQKTLALAPDNPFAKKKLEELAKSTQ